MEKMWKYTFDASLYLETFFQYSVFGSLLMHPLDFLYARTHLVRVISGIYSICIFQV